MEFRTFTVTYKDQKPIHLIVALGDNVTIRIGDWYFKGIVKKIEEKENPTSILNYNSPSGSMDRYCEKDN